MCHTLNHSFTHSRRVTGFGPTTPPPPTPLRVIYGFKPVQVGRPIEFEFEFETETELETELEIKPSSALARPTPLKTFKCAGCGIAYVGGTEHQIPVAECVQTPNAVLHYVCAKCKKTNACGICAPKTTELNGWSRCGAAPKPGKERCNKHGKWINNASLCCQTVHCDTCWFEAGGKCSHHPTTSDEPPNLE